MDLAGVLQKVPAKLAGVKFALSQALGYVSAEFFIIEH